MAEESELGREAENTPLEGSRRFDLSAGALLLALLAILFTCSTDWQVISYRRNYPNVSLEDAPRALFVLSESQRMALQGAPLLGALNGSTCPGCSRNELRRAWDELDGERRRLLADGYVVPGLADERWSETARLARAVSLAGFGDVQALAEVRATSDDALPPYLIERARELRGERDGAARVQRAVRLALWLSGLSLAMMVAGLTAWLWWIRRGHRSLPLLERAAPRITPERAILVFAWAHAAHAVAMRLYWLQPGLFADWFRIMPSATLAAAASALWWGTRPRGERASPAWPADARGWALTLLPALFVIALDLGAGLAIDVGAAALGHRAAWGESVDELILFDPLPVALLSAFDVVVLAPLSEELLFRGALFGGLLRFTTLRRAALLSSAVFAAWHGYGVVGTAVVGVSGYLWALLYARTGSLLPCMVCHGTINLLFALETFAIRP